MTAVVTVVVIGKGVEEALAVMLARAVEAAVTMLLHQVLKYRGVPVLEVEAEEALVAMVALAVAAVELVF